MSLLNSFPRAWLCLMPRASAAYGIILRSYHQVAIQEHSACVRGSLRSVKRNDSFAKRCCILPRRGFSSASLTVIGTGGNELQPSFQIKCEGSSYLFNCVESLLRYSCIALKKADIVFFTRASWETTGGGVSYYLNWADTNNRMQYCGPLKCDYYMNLIRSSTGKNSWEAIEDSSYLCDDEINVSVINLTVPGDEQRSHTVVAYSCKLSDDPGKLDVEKAAELGVLPGPAFKLLKMGRSVFTKSGGMVHPAQVMGETTKGPSFLVIDCPNRSFLESVCSNQKLQPQWFREKGESLKLMVHITPLHILEEELYCKWMASFGDGVDHLFLHSSVCPGEVSLRRALTFSMPYHLMNPQVYHFPRIPSEDKIRLEDMKVSKYVNQNSLLIGRVGLKLQLKPTNAVDFSGTLEPLRKYLQTSFEALHQELSSKIQAYHRLISTDIPYRRDDVVPLLMRNGLPAARLDDSKDCMVTTLGTGASKSMPIYNVSGTLVQTLQDGNVLLDCGEGTVQQLYRCFGKTQTHAILRNLRTIFISHIHPDHWSGLVGILHEIFTLSKGLECPVTVIGPKNLLGLLAIFGSQVEMGNVSEIKSLNLVRMPFHQMKLSLRTVPVNHIPDSYALILSRGKDWSVVYSGDTAPCKNLVREGRNATLLIHEATYGSFLYSTEAKRLLHCNYPEAIDISKAMNAYFTILTHINYQYKYPFEHVPGVVPAVDLMSVRISDLHRHQLDSRESRAIVTSAYLSKYSLNGQDV